MTTESILPAFSRTARYRNFTDSGKVFIAPVLEDALGYKMQKHPITCTEFQSISADLLTHRVRCSGASTLHSVSWGACQPGEVGSRSAHITLHPHKSECRSRRHKRDRHGKIFLQRHSRSYCSGDKDQPFAFIGMVKSRNIVASFATCSKYYEIQVCTIQEEGRISIYLNEITLHAGHTKHKTALKGSSHWIQAMGSCLSLRQTK